MKVTPSIAENRDVSLQLFIKLSAIIGGALGKVSYKYNYWWNDIAPAYHKPILALIHTVALMSELPAEQREVWRSFFNYFAFHAEGNPAAHLPSDLRDVVGKLSASDRDEVLAFVAERLKTLLGQ